MEAFYVFLALITPSGVTYELMEAEYATYTQVFPYTDRLNYVSPMINNCGWAMAVEKLMGLTGHLPRRAEYVRVIVSEMSRMTDHLTCIGASAMELGAFTAFLYFLKAREWLYELLEKVSGARLTHSYVRIGGVVNDLPDNFHQDLTLCLDQMSKVMVEVEDLLNHNKIFRDRMAGVGAMTKEDAIATGCVGPIARAAGVDYDVRKDYPYSIYPEVEFDVPVGTTGDCYDRYLVRVEELRQSNRIIEQCVAWLKANPGPVMIDDRKVRPPRREEMKGDMESLIHHFKLMTEGYCVPAGEVYAAVEAPKGELGVYLVSDGANKPYRLKVRPPGFAHLASLDEMVRGHMLADVVAVIGTQDIVFGEIDR